MLRRKYKSAFYGVIVLTLVLLRYIFTAYLPDTLGLIRDNAALEQKAALIRDASSVMAANEKTLHQLSASSGSPVSLLSDLEWTRSLGRSAGDFNLQVVNIPGITLRDNTEETRILLEGNFTDLVRFAYRLERENRLANILKADFYLDRLRLGVKMEYKLFLQITCSRSLPES